MRSTLPWHLSTLLLPYYCPTTTLPLLPYYHPTTTLLLPCYCCLTTTALLLPYHYPATDRYATSFRAKVRARRVVVFDVWVYVFFCQTAALFRLQRPAEVAERVGTWTYTDLRVVLGHS